jgi:hypothetical protein
VTTLQPYNLAAVRASLSSAVGQEIETGNQDEVTSGGPTAHYGLTRWHSARGTRCSTHRNKQKHELLV